VILDILKARADFISPANGLLYGQEVAYVLTLSVILRNANNQIK